MQTTLDGYDIVPKSSYQLFDDRCTQRDIILALLMRKSFVPTSLLRLRAYQYNTRIFELRRGQHDGIAYDIKSVMVDGIYGYSLNKEGVVLNGITPTHD